MTLIVAHLVDQLVEYCHQPIILGLGAWDVQNFGDSRPSRFCLQNGWIQHGRYSFHFPSSYSEWVNISRIKTFWRLKWIAASNRTLFPPMLKTNNLPT